MLNRRYSKAPRMNLQIFIVILLASTIFGCSSPNSITTEPQLAGESQNLSSFSQECASGSYHLGIGAMSKNLYLHLKEDSTFDCQWFDYGSRGCAGGQVRGECSGTWKAEGDLVKIISQKMSGYFIDRPLGNLVAQTHGIVKVLIQENDREEFDKWPSVRSCFCKYDPNMRPYRKSHEWPEPLAILIANNRQFATDVEDLSVNTVDNCFILKTSTDSKLHQRIIDEYKLEKVSKLHPLVNTLVPSTSDSRLRWLWNLKRCNLHATAGYDATQRESKSLFAVIDHPVSKESIVFIQWK